MKPTIEIILKEEKDLAFVEKFQATDLFNVPNAVEAVLAKIEELAVGFTPTLETKKGREEIASMARKVSSSKVYLDTLGKDLVADWKEKAKVVDNQRRVICERLDRLRDTVRKPLTEYEEKIKAHEALIQEFIQRYKNAQSAIYYKSNDVFLALESLKVIPEIDVTWGKEEENAKKIKQECLFFLEAKFENLKKQEEETKRLAEESENLRKEKEEFERKKREDQIRAEEAKKAEDELKKKDEDKKRAIIEAELAQKKLEEERVKNEALRKERETQQKQFEEQQKEIETLRKQKLEEDRKKAEDAKKAQEEETRKKADEKRALDLEHRKKINNEILASFAAEGIDRDLGVKLITKVVKGEIKHLKINY